MPIGPPGSTIQPTCVASAWQRSRLKVAQINVKKAPLRLTALNAYMERNPWDVVALQDPPPHLPWCDLFKQYHIVWEHTGDGELTTYNNPYTIDSMTAKPARSLRDKAERKLMKVVPLYKVAFLVSSRIPMHDWTVDWYTGDVNRTLLCTLRLETRLEATLAIHNFYNAYENGIRQLDIEALLRACTVSGFDLMLGDSNLKHDLWAGKLAKPPNKDATDLAIGIQAADMECLVKPDEIKFTYTRGQNTEIYKSTIDIAISGPGLTPYIYSFRRVDDVEGFESDHRVLETTIDTTTRPLDDPRYRWRDASPKEWKAAVGPRLKNELKSLSLESRAHIDTFFAEAVRIMAEERDQQIPKTKTPVLITKVKPADPAFLAVGNQLFNPTRADNAANRRHNRYIRDQRAQRTKEYRLFVASGAKTVFQLARMSARRSLPRAPSHIPVLQKVLDENNTRKYYSHEDKAEYLVETLWPRYSCGTEPPPILECPPIPGPCLDDSAQKRLKPGELRGVVRGMPAHKAEGKDGISIDALKMLLPSKEDPEDIVTSVFQRAMQACLDLSYHPEEFKEAVTVMLPKAGKPKHLPGSYRPIALLSAFAKVLEKLFTIRLVDWLLAARILPFEQFGFRDKNATQALEFILNAIYKYWLAKNAFVTVAALDMTAAFNRVLHDHLLSLLVEYGVPRWMIQFIWEFLSRRSTTVRLQGKLSKKFWIKIGVPQGSPLSPILFVVFTIPILKRLRESRTLESNDDMAIFQLFDLVITGYVDDITILLASSSYELNCKALGLVYRRLTRFTSLHGTEFSADKTKVMHLCQSRRALAVTDLMPKVSGFPKEAETSVRILGLHLDYQLKWNVHIAHILAKVRQKMYQMRRVCASTWGPNVRKLCHQYITSIRPIFAYGCALWYVIRSTKGTRCRWSLCQQLFQQLETEQNHCLRQLSGAYRRVSGDVLCKELFIERLSVFLAGCAMKHRAKNLTKPEGQALLQSWNFVANARGLTAEVMESHPLNVAYREAQALVLGPAFGRLLLQIEADPKIVNNPGQQLARLRRLINKIVKELSHTRSEELWNKFVLHHLCEAAGFNESYPALQGLWGKHNAKLYADMPKAQSTMLLHIRTGFNGLNATLHFMGLVSSPKCPCGEGIHNAKHLFLHCELLNDARKHLLKELPNLTFEALLTLQPRAAADFAIRYFGIPQFRWTAKHMPNPAFGNLVEEEDEADFLQPSDLSTDPHAHPLSSSSAVFSAAYAAFYIRQQRPRCHSWPGQLTGYAALPRTSSKTSRQDLAIAIWSLGLCILKGVVLLIAASLALWLVSILVSWGVPRAKPCGMRSHGSGRMEHIVKV
ncbi:putative RNA-directed DNA polymerase from transposon BS [Colletotrichum siamense]|uniref:putative RNA-directed DNA polymerase from transposon BS n=1 Tax=Colletotrichum siamense TaxID=690259 RepID=UPI0018727616|nr:putative RNA-directed DNA polymerase from transposon BS [Colletotrichum siamense]KAF5517138.1 putative RNA-directed DNA polymerase from transposon BS [Colletotrichum siamense]